MKDRVAEIYGRDTVTAWLDKLALVQIDGLALVFSAPTKFLARHVEDSFAERLVAAWHHTSGDASVRDVRILVGHPRRVFRTSPAPIIAPEIPALREASA